MKTRACGHEVIWTHMPPQTSVNPEKLLKMSAVVKQPENTHSRCSVYLQPLSACQLTRSLSFSLMSSVCVFCISIIQQWGRGRRSCRAHRAGSAKPNSSAGCRHCRFLAAAGAPHVFLPALCTTFSLYSEHSYQIWIKLYRSDRMIHVWVSHLLCFTAVWLSHMWKT